jgi:hypothetical protein
MTGTVRVPDGKARRETQPSRPCHGAPRKQTQGVLPLGTPTNNTIRIPSVQHFTALQYTFRVSPRLSLEVVDAEAHVECCRQAKAPTKMNRAILPTPHGEWYPRQEKMVVLVPSPLGHGTVSIPEGRKGA